MKINGKIDVVIPDRYKPSKVETEVAWILAEHYKTEVYIIRPVNRYKVKTADYIIDGVEYELKTPETHLVDKVVDRIREGARQAGIIVVYTKKTKILDKRMVELVQEALKEIKLADKIVLVKKDKTVLEFSK